MIRPQPPAQPTSLLKDVPTGKLIVFAIMSGFGKYLIHQNLIVRFFFFFTFKVHTIRFRSNRRLVFVVHHVKQWGI